jgi:asparagine synthase (glutamine-hydrolysing)
MESVTPTAEHVIYDMCQCLRHRGPDDYGTWRGGPMALGHTRLSIIDLFHGQQPLSNEDETVWVSFNGEIYNFQELTERLKSRGHRFETNSDTEVLVHLYEDFGPDFVTELNGMFALAIWDSKRRRLVLARDRMGQKPLYWTHQNGHFVFASEMKSLIAHPGVERRIDLNSISRYLGVAAVPAPYTIFEEIYKLPPAGRLIVENGRIREDTYWEYPLGKEKSRLSLDDAGHQLTDLLRESVRRRLISDVPLGVFLSGGLDSSLIAALMSEIAPGRIESFCIGFDDVKYDESRFAEIVARHLNTIHHCRRLDPRAAAHLIPKLGRLLDEPLADGSIVPTYLLSQFAREHVKVAVGGDGSDELFAGYPLYAAQRTLQRWERLPGFKLVRYLQGFVDRLPASADRRKVVIRLKKLLMTLQNKPGVERHYAWKNGVNARLQQQLFSEDAWNGLSPDTGLERAQLYASQCPSDDIVEQMLYLDAKLFMQDVVLTKVDRASMAVGLEARAPFLDHKVVEFVASLPVEYKVKGMTTKRLLKEVGVQYLPREIVHRSKQGFASPVENWLRTDFRPMMEDMFAEDRVNSIGLFNPRTIRKMMNEHFSGRTNWHQVLWPLFMFELWRDEYGNETLASRDDLQPAIQFN